VYIQPLCQTGLIIQFIRFFNALEKKEKCERVNLATDSCCIQVGCYLGRTHDAQSSVSSLGDETQGRQRQNNTCWRQIPETFQTHDKVLNQVQLPKIKKYFHHCGQLNEHLCLAGSRGGEPKQYVRSQKESYGK